MKRLPAAPVAALFCLLASGLCGCGGAPSGPSAGAGSAASSTAETGGDAAAVLARMKKAYAAAESYGDAARFIQETVVKGDGVRRPMPVFNISVRFQAPNKLRFSLIQPAPGRGFSAAYDVACDGEHILSRTASVPGQVHVADAPAELTEANFLPAKRIREALLDEPLSQIHAPLAMLLGATGELYAEESTARLDGESTVGGFACDVVVMTGADGERKLWVDQDSGLLRRMEVPVDGQRKRLQSDGVIEDLRIYIEFDEASLEGPIDEGEFAMRVAEESVGVSRFVAAPAEPPAEGLGAAVAPFSFQTLEGEEVTPASLAGKVVLMDFWFTGCPPCRTQAPVLQEVYEAFADDDRVRLMAVSTDSERITNEKVEVTLRDWGNGMPIVRDLGQEAYTKLGVQGTPAMILLGPDGRVQVSDLGVHPEAAPVIEKVRKLTSGVDLAGEAAAEYLNQKAAYDRELSEARVPLPSKG
ncbi:MAG: redoxin domain-containing protein [Planctomycetota bacterium]